MIISTIYKNVKQLKLLDILLKMQIATTLEIYLVCMKGKAPEIHFHLILLHNFLFFCCFFPTVQTHLLFYYTY